MFTFSHSRYIAGIYPNVDDIALKDMNDKLSKSEQ